MTPLELKRRYNRTETWKGFNPDVKEKYRDFWKMLDKECEHMGGLPKMVRSLSEPIEGNAHFINGCIFGEYGGREGEFKDLIHFLEKPENSEYYQHTEYAVQLFEGSNNQFFYENDGEYQHTKLMYLIDYEDAERSVTVEHHQHTAYPSGIVNDIQYLRRIRQSEDEYSIQGLVKLSKEFNARGSLVNGRRLANAVLNHFKE